MTIDCRAEYMGQCAPPSPKQDRFPPHSAEAEQGVLGCCLLGGALTVGLCQEGLRAGAESFYDLRHQCIYNALVWLVSKNKAVDTVTVVQAIKDNGEIEASGGMAYVVGLTDNVPSVAHLPAYLEIVRGKHILRNLARVCAEGAASALGDTSEVQAVCDIVERRLTELSELRAVSHERKLDLIVRDVIERMEEYQRGRAQLRGIPTGFDYLDKMLTGFCPGNLIVLAARPGMGKTSMAMNIADHVGVNLGLPVGIFSLEMSQDELASRMVFARAQADYQRYRTGYMENADLPRMLQSVAELAKAAIWIDDSADSTVTEIRAKARRWRHQHGIRLFILDYMQLVTGENRYNNRESEVAAISRNLKGLARELEVPLLVVAQLNRSVEKERNRRPQLSDLRESGAIENDADAVLMLYKAPLEEDADENSDWAKKNVLMNCLVAKQRNGPTGDSHFIFHKSFMRFEEDHS